MTVSDAALANRASTSPAPSAVAEGREASGRVMTFVHTLPENQRDVVLLKFSEGLSYKEISAITELSVSNVGYLLHTALKTLRTRMQSQPATA